MERGTSLCTSIVLWKGRKCLENLKALAWQLKVNNSSGWGPQTLKLTLCSKYPFIKYCVSVLGNAYFCIPKRPSLLAFPQDSTSYILPFHIYNKCVLLKCKTVAETVVWRELWVESVAVLNLYFSNRWVNKHERSSFRGREACLSLTRLLIYAFPTTTALSHYVPVCITFQPEPFIDPMSFKGKGYLTTGPL